MNVGMPLNKQLYNMLSKALYSDITITSVEMAPPLADPLLLANMESVALMLDLICTMHNKIKASVVALIDLGALLLHMLHVQSTSIAS